MRRRALLSGAGATLLAAACGGPQVRAPGDTAPLRLNPVFGDADPHPWTGRRPETYAVHGIDLSRWQPSVNWVTARAAGVSFAWIKATEGGDILDHRFESHWRESHRAGVRRGAYHFFFHCRPAVEQAEWFIRHVPREPDSLRHALDMEWTPFSPTCTIRRDGAVLRAEAARFLDILESHYGRRPVIYTTVDFHRDTGIGALPRTEFWLRSTADHPSVTYPGARWTIWQYSGTGLVPGIAGKVDLNAFRGSADEWEGWSRA